MAFSTRDRDNDRWSKGSCANLYEGGWWYKECGVARLNDLHPVIELDSDMKIYMESCLMKIRPQ